MAKYSIKQIIDKVQDLPTLPQIIINLMSAIDDPRSSANHIKQIMVNDPALASRVLKLVNSSFYSLPRKITSIRDAVVILGFTTVRSLAISASVLETFGNSGFSHENFWEQSLAVGLIAEYLESKSPVLDNGNAFTVGLLHGIGKIILEQHFSEQFDDIMDIAKERQLNFDTAEKEVLETSYTEIGYWLTNRWQLPEIAQNGLHYQSDPLACPEPPFQPLAAVVHISKYLCRLYGDPAATDFDEIKEPAEEIWNLLQLPNRDGLEEQVKKRLESAKNIFSELM